MTNYILNRAIIFKMPKHIGLECLSILMKTCCQNVSVNYHVISTVSKLPIQKCMGKIAVQLKLYRESEIAWKISEIPQ